jgi:hypothetical protein
MTDDPLKNWRRDRARGIDALMLPRYDADRAQWTVYGDDVATYADGLARIENVKAGLAPDGSFDEIGAAFDRLLAAMGYWIAFAGKDMPAFA